MKKYLFLLLFFGCKKEESKIPVLPPVCKTCNTSGYVIQPSGSISYYTMPQPIQYCNGEWVSHEGNKDTITVLYNESTHKYDTTKYHSFTSCN